MKLAGWTNKTDGAWECGWTGCINGSRPGLVLLFFSFYSSPDSSVSPSVVGVCTLAKFSLFFRLYNCDVFDVWNGCQKLLCHISLPTFSRGSQSMIRQGRITVRTPPSDGMIGRVHSYSKIISMLKETPFSPSRKAFWKKYFCCHFLIFYFLNENKKAFQ